MLHLKNCMANIFADLLPMLFLSPPLKKGDLGGFSGSYKNPP
jgi:hypothetical protein